MSGEYWNIIRIGTVEAVDTAAARVKVTFDELEITSDWLPVLQRGAGSWADYWLPGSGDKVVCIFYSDGTEEGACIGSYYPAGDPPPESGAGVYCTVFPDGSLVKWNNGQLTVTAIDGVTLNAETIINGDVLINGSLSVTGAAGGSGSVSISAPGGVNIIGSASITGAMNITGGLNVSGVVNALDFVKS